jgi:hypothetical protein
MALTPRQRRFYTDRCTIYPPSETRNANGRVTATGWSVASAQTDVPCYFEIRGSAEGPAMFGRTEEDIAISQDTIHFGADVTVDADYLILNQTLNTRDGSQSQNYGRYWMVRGQPKSVSQRGRRRMQKRAVAAVQLEFTPTGIA